MSIRLQTIVGALCAVLAVSPGCKVFDDSLVSSLPPGVPPRPPAGTSSPTDDSGTLTVYALKDVFLQQDAEFASTIALDLDGVQTVDNATSSCIPDNPTADAQLDGAGGGDNTLGTSLLPAVGTQLPCLEDNLALSMAKGNGTILLHLRGWNGQPNDAQIAVTVTSAVDGTSALPGDVTDRTGSDTDLLFYRDDAKPPGSGPDPLPAPDPAWDGGDSWYVDTRDYSGENPGQPLNEFTSAYVAAGRLVILFPDNLSFTLVGLNGALEVQLSGGVMMADLDELTLPGVETPVPGISRGIIAGRYNIRDLEDATPTIGICNTGLITAVLGNIADIQTNPLDVENGACDALSLAIPFTGVRGSLAGFAVPFPQPEPCVAGTMTPPLIPPTDDTCCPSMAYDVSKCDVVGNTVHAGKKADFDALSERVVVPVPQPAF